ncbi:MAG: cell filamentation protein Fic [candidate division Zixibacteria bacterium RBG_16_53_22]|nr:MAG: cell filamentation protein Fic [candidate division Zixibacteria bacterium RBG_16_53_22]
MDIKKFSSGKWLNDGQYKYFLPTEINREWLISDARLQRKVESVSLRLGELNSFAKFVPNIDLFIQSYVLKEAVTSSRIEGTSTNMEQAFSQELDINPERRDDWRETRQYVIAMNNALSKLKELPLSNRLIKNTHEVLLSHVRGKHKGPGKFRRSQNWIGGATIDDAVFVPPSAEHVESLMSDLEKFLHNDKIAIPHLVKIAIAHYQFETIHPFLDGNGRIGRLLITLYLISRGMLEKPLLYASDYFEKNKSLYYDKLTFAREKNDLGGWIYFFLQAIETTAIEAAAALKDILALKDRLTSDKIPTLGRKTKTAQRFLDLLFTHPVVTAAVVGKELGFSPKASNDLLRDFTELEILRETTGYKRNRLFEFAEYLKILKR